jgi:hypothetical protein
VADRLDTLGAAAPGAALTILYTVPAGKEAIGVLTVCNVGGSDRSFRVSVNPAGGATQAVPSNHYYDTPLLTYQTIEGLLAGVGMDAGTTIVVYGSHADVVFRFAGVERDAE